jgi:hypothetical protein
MYIDDRNRRVRPPAEIDRIDANRIAAALVAGQRGGQR